MNRRLLCIGLLSVTGMLTACTQPHRTTMLSNEVQERYTYAEVEEHAGRVLPKKLIAVTFSGGGTRAAALAYGALTGLRDTVSKSSTIPNRRLIDEVDMVSAVSGGSVTAAYWALKGADGLEDLKRNFLERNIHCDLFCKMVNPRTVLQLMTPAYARSDIIREIFDTLLFQGAIYGDLFADGSTEERSANGRPYLILNAMDMTSTGTFPLTQTSFSLLCADLTKFKLADAVGASAAYPGWFTSVPLKNHIHDENCPVKDVAETASRTEILTSWIEEGLSNAETELNEAKTAAKNARNRKHEAKRQVDKSQIWMENRREAAAGADDEVKRRNTALARAKEEKINQANNVIETKARAAYARKELKQIRAIVNINKQKALYDKAVDARDKAQKRLDKITGSNGAKKRTVNREIQEDTFTLQDESSIRKDEDVQSEDILEETNDDAAIANAKMEVDQAQALVDQEDFRLNILTTKIYTASLALARAIDARTRGNESHRAATAEVTAAEIGVKKAKEESEQRSREYKESEDSLAEANRVFNTEIRKEEKAQTEEKNSEDKLDRIKGVEELLVVLKQIEQEARRSSVDYSEEYYQTVHLLDGGIADNLGVSPLLELLHTIFTIAHKTEGEVELGNLVDQVIVIVVDAATILTPSYGRKPNPPGLIDTLTTAVGASINSKSVLLRDKLKSLKSDLEKNGIEVSVVDVGFDAISEQLEANGDSITGDMGKPCEQWFQKIPTNWSLDSSEIESVIQLGSALVRSSMEYQKFIREIGFGANSENNVLEVCTSVLGNGE